MTTSERWWSIAILGAAPALILLAGAFVPPISQDASYHNFADQRTIWGIPNFWNVASNVAFLIAAALGAWVLRSRFTDLEVWQRTARRIVLGATVLVALGSAYYHLTPSAATLFWDRLPMTIVFMSIFALMLGELIHDKAGRKSLFPLLAAGVASALAWKMTGDLRWYAMVQFYPMIAIASLLIFRGSRCSARGSVVAMIVLYAAAKILELSDQSLGGVIATGGHPWKHVFAAAALACYMIPSRRKAGFTGTLQELKKRADRGACAATRAGSLNTR